MKKDWQVSTGTIALWMIVAISAMVMVLWLCGVRFGWHSAVTVGYSDGVVPTQSVTPLVVAEPEERPLEVPARQEPEATANRGTGDAGDTEPERATRTKPVVDIAT
jgi:hypothetical protein